MNREISTRFQSTFGEDPRNRASRIDKIIHRDQIEIQPEITEQSASFITRVARAVSNSRAKAVGLLFPLIAGLPACADNTVDSTTTTPPTTIPATSTTEGTTTLPPTTTTEAPTVTTTLPADICEATGQASIDGQNIELGLFREGYDFTDFDEGVTGRLVDVYEMPYEDYAGEKTTVLYVDACVEEYTYINGSRSPLIVSIMLGRPGLDTLDTKWFTQADLIMSNKRGDQFYPLEDIKTELESRLLNNSQVGFIIPNYDVPQLPDDFNFDEWLQGCIENYSNLGFSEDDFNFLVRCQ